MKQKSVYIAGPMSGYPNFNFDNFNRVAASYKKAGWNVYNPADKDAEDGVQEAAGFDTGDQAALIEAGWDFREAYLWDITSVLNSDAIYMLNGWENSPGARGEHAVAVFVKKNYPEFQIVYE